jgi:hypothetical protein
MAVMELRVRVTLTAGALSLTGSDRLHVPRLLELMGVVPAIPSLSEENGAPIAEAGSSDAIGDVNEWDVGMAVGENLTEADPGAPFKSTLRPYQARGLGWMLERERVGGSKEAPDPRNGLHALWAEYRFPEGGQLYVKGSDGELSVVRPSASPSPRGVSWISPFPGLGFVFCVLSLVMP